MKTALTPSVPSSSLFCVAPEIAPPPQQKEWSAYLSRHGRSFWMASQMIPQPQRSQVAGVYAYCRYTDDLVDQATCSSSMLLDVIDEWQAMSRAAYAGRMTGVELLDIVMGDMARHGVPFDYVVALLHGMRTDVRGERFETFAQLELYCHDVASVVGLWLTELFGVHDAWTLDRADRLGIAMQLTNIARDVGEDWDRGRIYFPDSMLEAYGISDESIDQRRHGSNPVSPSFGTLVEALMTEADEGYAMAEPAMDSLPVFFRSAVAVASRVYSGIHGAIRANGYDCLRTRAVVSDPTKRALARAALASVRLS